MLVLYTRPGCLFCKQVEELFVEEKLPHRVVEITSLEKQNEVLGPTGSKAFPLVFFNAAFVGGFTHVVHLHSLGRLQELAQPATGSELPKPKANPAERPTQRTSASAAFDEIAGFAKWGEHLKNKRPRGGSGG